VSGIVVIEEDKLMRGLLVEWLSAAGYAARAVASCDVAKPHDVDLVIVDLYMPRLDGARRLCNVKAEYPGTPLIAISAQFLPGLVGSSTAAEALGVEQVIAKPFSRSELLAAVGNVIGPPG
jgi:CheY-like chemotaxis protein